MKWWRQQLFLFGICFLIYSHATGSETSSNLSFTTINRFSNSPNDFGEVDDIRKFTSEALFSESDSRLGRSLTEGEIGEIVRTKEQWETFNLLQWSVSQHTAIDFSYKYRALKDAQITNFYYPGAFNDVDVQELGLALRTVISKPAYEIFLRGAFKPVRRKGIVEFQPETNEDLFQYEFNSIVSFHLDHQTLSLYPTLVFQDINPDTSNPQERNRTIGAMSFTYGNLSSREREKKEAIPISSMDRLFERHFDRRGLRLFGGFVYDRETYGDTDVTKMDYYAGTTLDLKSGFSVAVQPGIFSYDVNEDASQNNAQYRTNLSVYCPPIKGWQIIFPFRHDIAVGGPDYYENWKAGVASHKSFSFNSGKFTCHGAIRYDHQEFFRTDKSLDIFSVKISLDI